MRQRYHPLHKRFSQNSALIKLQKVFFIKLTLMDPKYVSLVKWGSSIVMCLPFILSKRRPWYLPIICSSSCCSNSSYFTLSHFCTFTLSLSQFHIITLSHSHNFTISHYHTFTLSHIHPFTLSQYDTFTLSHFHTLTFTLSHFHTITL